MLLDEETLKQASQMNEHVLEFAKNNPAPPIDWDDPNATKLVMDGLAQFTLSALGPAEANITEEYRKIPMRDGFESEIKIARPSQISASNGPMIVFIFGGGFIAGSHDLGTAFARGFVRLFGATVVSISYRLAPEYQWPTGWNDAFDSVEWLAANAAEVNADPTKGFIVGGISAGGSLSAFITAESRTHKLAHPITGQWLSMATLMTEENVPERYKSYYRSVKENKDDPVLPPTVVESLKKLTGWDDSSPMRWPVLYDPSNLPPTYLQADGMDPLRDDSLIYHEMLQDAGIQTEIDFYPGCPHVHFAVMPGIEPSNKAFADLMVNVGWLLGKPVTAESGLKAMGPTL